MNHFTTLQKLFSWQAGKNTIRIFSVLLGLFVATTLQAAVITHNIGTGGNLVIQGTNTNDYIVTGTTTANRIIVGQGYQGTITLRNVSITSNAAANYTALCGNGTNLVTTGSCIAIMGKNNQSNLSPVTKVNIVLEGNNSLLQTSNSQYCAIQVDQGAQIHISAIDPDNNTSGKLTAKSSTYAPGSELVSQGGAAIGSVSRGISSPYAYNYIQGTSPLSGSCSGTGNTSGGNVIISSGTVTAWGGHGAGIGGGFLTYYDGNIIVYGGIIEARGGFDSAGIGSGCPTGKGVIGCYANNSTVVALPPAQITAYGAGLSANGGVGTGQFPSLGLAGMKNITYINDPNRSEITVKTIDNEPNANIYLDLTETPGLVNIFNTLSIDYDLKKAKVGQTDAGGLLKFRAQFEQNTTFFTDASSSKPATSGRPYMPVITTVMGDVNNKVTVTLPLLGTDISFTDYPSTPLEVGYTAVQARDNAFATKIEYKDVIQMTDVTFKLQDGAASNFSSIVFLKSDKVTVVPAPAVFNPGDVYYIVLPIKQGKPMGAYSDVLLIHGKWKGIELPGYIRRIGEQRVVQNDTDNNKYIKVTASPNKFTVTHPATNTVTLNLNINHTGIAEIPYKPADVTAKYLITTKADYDAALAETPLSGWTNMNIPANENVNTSTTVSFNGKPIGTYYIHWYVISGVVYAHSLTVTDPPRTYGGFGPYRLYTSPTTGAITSDATNQTICYDDNVTLNGSASGGSGNYSYQWQESANGTSGWVNVAGAGTGTNCTISNLKLTTYYRLTINDNVLNITVESPAYKITVRPMLVAGTISAGTNTVCHNSSATITGPASVGGSGTYSYQWQQSANGTNGWANIAGATGLKYTTPNLTSTTYFKRITTDNTCGNTDSNILELSVRAPLQGGTISIAQSTICYNTSPGTISVTYPTGGNGTYTYKWYSSTNGTTWTLINNALGGIYIPGKLKVKTYFKREATDNGCGSADSNILEINVYPEMIQGTIDGNPSVCIGESAGVIVGEASVGGSGSFTYQWQHTPKGQGIWTNIVGATGQNCYPGKIGISTEYRRITMDASCGNFFSNVFTINIVEDILTLYWKKNPVDNNWNNPANWEDASGVVLGMIPVACTNVYIPNSASIYPSLDPLSSPSDICGPPICRNITFAYSSQLAYQHKLTYDSAYVQYNFGYYSTLVSDAQPTANKDGNPGTVIGMKRNQWYPLAAPLRKMASGDFAFGGYPFTWQATADVVSGENNFYSINFNKSNTKNDIDLSTTNNSIAIKVPLYRTGANTIGHNSHTNLQALKGVLEIPYFNNTSEIPYHPGQSYDEIAKQSTFYYFNNSTLQVIHNPVGKMKRSDEASRFVFEDDEKKIEKVIINGVEVPCYTMEVSPNNTHRHALIGNPFIATINMKAFFDANSSVLDNTSGYYVYNSESAWKTYPYAIDNGVNSFQSFVVVFKTAAANQTLRFPLEGIYALTGTATGNIPRRMQHDNTLNVSISDQKGLGGDYAELNPVGYIAENNLTGNVRKLIGEESHTTPEVFFVNSDNTAYNLMQIYNEGEMVVDLGIRYSDTKNQLTLSFDKINEFAQLTGTTPVLIDKFLNREQDLTANNTYAFKQQLTDGSKNKYTDASRFSIYFDKEPTSAAADGIKVYYHQGDLTVKSTKEITNVKVYNMSGQLVFGSNTIKADDTLFFRRSIGLPLGTYVVRVNTVDNIVNRKILATDK